jgi:hypothetical protein
VLVAAEAGVPQAPWIVSYVGVLRGVVPAAADAVGAPGACWDAANGSAHAPTKHAARQTSNTLAIFLNLCSTQLSYLSCRMAHPYATGDAVVGTVMDVNS